MAKRIIATLLVIAAALTPACRAIPGSRKLPVPPEKEYVIGFSPSNMMIDFNDKLFTGVQKAAEKYKIKMLVKNAMADPEKQEEDIKWLAEQEIDALIIQPTHSQKIGRVIDSLKDRGIPVITVVTPAHSGNVKVHVGPDYTRVAEDSVSALARLLKTRKTAKAVLICAQRNLESLKEYHSSFVKELEKLDGVEIIDEISCPSTTPSHGIDALNKAVSKHQEFDIAFAVVEQLLIGGPSTVPISRDIILIAGIGSSEKCYFAVKQGSLDLFADIMGENIGEKAVETAYRLIKREKLPPRVITGYRIVTIDNVDKYKQ